MEFTSLVSTSLDLNSKPIRTTRDHPRRLPIPKEEEEEEVGDSSFLGLATTNLSVMPPQHEKAALMGEITRVAEENTMLKEKLRIVWDRYSELKKQLDHQSSKNSDSDNNNTASKKRKKARGNNDNNVGSSESSSSDEESIKKPREEFLRTTISQVHVRTEASDTSLIVKDGYQWRKYGQKVTRDNPSPRAYFKCSFAPNCPVKKKVQRSVEDQSVLIATYEGEHNHPHPSRTEANSNTNSCVSPVGNVPSSTSPSPTITLDLTKKKQQHPLEATRGKVDNLQLQELLVEHMASALTKDPSFKAALASAISGKLLHQSSQPEKW